MIIGSKMYQRCLQVRPNVNGVARASKKKGHPGTKNVVDGPSGCQSSKNEGMKENRPSKKGRYSEGGIQRRVCVGTGGAVDLPPSTETIEGIKETWAHETDKAEENDLCAGMIEDGLGTDVGDIVIGIGIWILG